MGTMRLDKFLVEMKKRKPKRGKKADQKRTGDGRRPDGAGTGTKV